LVTPIKFIGWLIPHARSALADTLRPDVTHHQSA
jgi:hypothetical protein